MKERVYLYTRVSTLMQTEGYSLEAQRQKILEYAKFRDFIVAGEYSDAGFSGKNIAGRAQFQQMMADIESKKDDITYVLVFKLSRFGRNCADTLNSLKFMQDYGVNLICVDDNLDSSAATGKLMISVMSAMAEIERENINAQTKAGHEQKAKEGGWNGGPAPYGYTLENGQLIVQEDEAEVIREIYNLFVNTAYGPSKVAKEINKKYKKIPRANGYLDSFTMALVKDILDNPVYTGRIAYGRHTTEKIDGKRNEFHIVKQTAKEKIIMAEGQHKAIVSLEVWEAAQQKRKANAKTKEKIDKEHEYFLSGLLKCPSCGGPMYGIHNGRKKKKDGTYYPMSYSYACRSSSVAMARECSKPQNYSEPKLMEALTAIIKSLVNDKNFGRLVDVAIGQKTDVSELEKEKTLRKKELERLNRLVTQLENQLDALDYTSKAADLKEKSLNKRLNKAFEDMEDIQSQLADIEAQMEKIAAAESMKQQVYGILQSFDVLYDVMDNADRKLLIKELIEKIELYPREGRKLSGQWIKTIHFKFPMYYNDNNEASCAVCFDLNGNFLPKKSNDESVCTLVKADNSDETLNLKYIYDQLKDKYGLELTTGLALDAGFGWDMEVLTGKSILGRFYLYDEGCHYILNYDTDEGIANEHWHPDDTAEALELVVAFMEGTISVPDEGKVFPPKRITDEPIVTLIRE